VLRLRQFVILVRSAGRESGLQAIAFAGAEQGRVEPMTSRTSATDSTHHGRIEGARTGICHMLCHSFVDEPE
jgi:hypothetical protein